MKLKGRKYLIEKNHDRFVHQKEFEQTLFMWTKQLHELKYEGHTFVLCHYPMAKWNGFFTQSNSSARTSAQSCGCELQKSR